MRRQVVKDQTGNDSIEAVRTRGQQIRRRPPHQLDVQAPRAGLPARDVQRGGIGIETDDRRKRAVPLDRESGRGRPASEVENTMPFAHPGRHDEPPTQNFFVEKEAHGAVVEACRPPEAQGGDEAALGRGHHVIVHETLAELGAASLLASDDDVRACTKRDRPWAGRPGGGGDSTVETFTGPPA